MKLPRTCIKLYTIFSVCFCCWKVGEKQRKIKQKPMNGKQSRIYSKSDKPYPCTALKRRPNHCFSLF